MTESLSWWHVALFLTSTCAMMWISEHSIQRKVSAWIVCFVMICVSGLRHGYVDTRAYRTDFINLDVSSVLNSEYVFQSEGIDKGFTVLSALIKLFTDNSQIFLFVLAFFTVGFLFWGIYKNVDDRLIGIFLFIMTGCYLDTMNGLRQCFVSAVLFYYLPKLILEKNFIKYVVIVLLASTVHGSAIIFIPLYFIAEGKIWSFKTFYIIVFLGIIYIFFNTGIGVGIAELLEGTRYGDFYGEMLKEGNTSVHIVRVFVAAAPLVLSLANYSMRNKRENCQYSGMHSIAFNMSIISFFCWLFAMKMKFFYRLAIYFQPYIILLICYELAMVRKKKDKMIITYIAMGCYLVFHLYTLYVMGSDFFVGYLKY